ncbi:histidine utilization repressor [Pararhizobium sp.]|uniref:histidine utilization repressor n=1 Tax=Pararhizobium sp. TaxID=1977563 RepID=UPI00271FFA55|nr:histidine utilization repressor [Pararhizobium sp.]MDO9418151.1 histidine utilization repressor [Pararhizobium sp.]
MTSIHQRIFDDIEAKIMSGVWQPGQRIPVEHDLTEQYNCSRMTVSKALTALVDRGMVVRRRRAGSFVAAPQIDRTVMDIKDIGTEARIAGHAYSYSILSRAVETLAPAEAAHIGVEAGSEVLRVKCLHLVNGQPNAIERRIIMLAAVPNARTETFAKKPPGSWLLAEVPWSEAKHVIRAIPADATTARLLEMQRGEACLTLARQTWQNGRTVTYVEITHPGDRYQFAAVFHPSTG